MILLLDLKNIEVGYKFILKVLIFNAKPGSIITTIFEYS